MLILRQFAASFRLAWRRLAWSRYMWVGLALAGLPVALAFLIARLTGRAGETSGLQDAHQLHEALLRSLYLHFVVFFTASLVGFSVMRQELQDQTLHYLLLQPAPRWVLLLGKLAGYLVLTSALCVAGLFLTYIAATMPLYGPRAVGRDLFSGGWLWILTREAFVLILGLLAYGSISMLAGSFLKGGTYALILLAWETALPYLPSTLKFWTVMHYLHSLLPQRIGYSPGLFQLLGEPASTRLSLAVLLGVPLLFTAIAAIAFQFRECLYTAEN